ncbi:MAG: MerR family transcriptional regulator [Nocardioidaceae bacterium]|nr:MerR family transcriptional regulator [Nocardioidaceae bacterium]
MATRLSIGEFSRMTHLSAKTLRYYHRVGVLEPVDVDPTTGYRRYDVAQLPTAQAIRRYRALEMPVERIREVLGAPDGAARDALLAAHLDEMENRLARTQEAVASLRSLLVAPVPTVRVEHVRVPATPVLAIADRIDLAELSDWYLEAFAELDAAVAASGLVVLGPRGGLWSDELFRDEHGEVTVFRPVEAAGDVAPIGRVVADVLPGVDLAVTVHAGPDAEIDRAYGALGAHVATRGIGAPGPVRERYLVSALDDPDVPPVTEIGWPVVEG